MRWFIKCLRHYADFSGRARRREYWMFALFNAIFLFVLTFLFALIFAANNFDEDGLPIAVYSAWVGLFALPGMAVAVRRLHDLGKSGWWMLIALIPLVGAIWLIVLMCTDGQTGGNRFGPDPKRSPETFADRAKLTSAGIALTIAAAIAVPESIAGMYHSLFNNMTVSVMDRITTFLFPLLLLAAGVLLLRSRTRESAKPALAVLLVWGIIASLFNFAVLFGQSIPVSIWINLFFHVLFIAIFFAVVLFVPDNRGLVRGSALAVIALEVIKIILYPNLIIQISDININGGGWVEVTGWILGISSLFSLTLPVAFIVTVWTFFSKKEELAPVDETQAFEAAPRGEADGHAVYDPSAPATASGGSGKSLTWKIIGLLASVGLIVGGLSGDLVLRGTESSGALVVFGIVLLIVDIISLATHNKSARKRKEYEEQLAAGMISSVELDAPATIRVVRDSSVIGMIVPYKVYLNHRFVGNIANGKSLDIETRVSHNIVTVDVQGNPIPDDFQADLQPGGYAEVHVKAGRFVKR